MKDQSLYSLSSDSKGRPLEGDNDYMLHLPPDIPAGNFWSVIVYDNQTHLMICTDQLWPSVYSSSKKLKINKDGSVDIWFGPDIEAGKENNWIKTIPGKGWNLILRLYEPLEPWIDGTWKPGDLEVIK